MFEKWKLTDSRNCSSDCKLVMLKSSLKQCGLPTFIFSYWQKNPFYFLLNRIRCASGPFLPGIILAKQPQQFFLNVTIFLYNIYTIIITEKIKPSPSNWLTKGVSIQESHPLGSNCCGQVNKSFFFFFFCQDAFSFF